MKMNKYFMICAAMLMTAAVSCNKEEFTPEVTSGVSFIATAELPTTRTAVDADGKPLLYEGE